MYETHWGLREAPFRSFGDPRCFYCGATHEEALARLHFLVTNGRRLGLLLGGSGSGKTLLLQVFAEQLRAAGHHVALLNMMALDGRELLWELATQLKRHPGVEDSAFQLWRAVVDRVAENRYQRVPTVILLDDADDASSEALAYVTRLIRQDTSADLGLTVVLATDPRRLLHLGRRLVDAVDLQIELESWEPADTSAYLETSLARAGAEQALFDGAATERLHELAQGVPRRISHLAELSLLAGAGRGLPRIDVATVESAYRELAAAR